MLNELMTEKTHPNRRRLRLPKFDYSEPNAYFVTICVEDRNPVLSTIVDGQSTLSEVGRIIEAGLLEIETRFEDVVLDTYVIMPDHVHAIVVLNCCSIKGHNLVVAQEKRNDLQAVIRAFKSISAVGANKVLNKTGQPFWQRSYYEHIIRNEIDLADIRLYIDGNPARWSEKHRA